MRAWVFQGAAVFTILAFALAYSLRDDIFQTLQDPGQPFQTYTKPPAPDYLLASAWVARPNLAIDSATLAEKGDVFVVVPEVYKGSESWNLPIADPRRREKLERIVRPNYVEPYRQAGRLFAPHYRQAALYAFLNNREDSRRAQDLAYQDVLRAFDAMLAVSPPERPLILVGHGQGAAHAQRLLADRFQGDLRTRLAVAYNIDHPLPHSSLGNIPACASDTDTNCVVAWSAAMPIERTRPERLRERTLVWSDGDYAPTQGRDLLCTNPLTWQVDSKNAPATLHKGGVSAIGFEPGRRPTLHSQQISARCEGGILRVSRPAVASLRRPRKFGGKFRTLPSNLFYADLRDNAVARVDALLAKGILPRRAPVLEPLDVESVEVKPIVVQ